MLTQERVKELLEYSPALGTFTWRVANSRRIKVGTLAGSQLKRGQIQINVDGKVYYAHRLVWLYVYGRWPVCEIDHKNGKPYDNRFCNLREASRIQNARNIGLRKNNKSGFTGVYKGKSAWLAHISRDGKMVYLGSFSTKELAAKAYRKAALAFDDKFFPRSV